MLLSNSVFNYCCQKKLRAHTRNLCIQLLMHILYFSGERRMCAKEGHVEYCHAR